VKILLVSQVFPPRTGGSGRWLWELYRRLPGANTMVEVIAGATVGSAEFDRSASLPIARMPLDFASWGISSLSSGLQYGRTFVSLRHGAARSKADVIHCGKLLPEGLLALMVKAWRRTPFCCFVHGEELALARTTRELTYLSKKVLRHSEMIVANSRHSKGLLTDAWEVPENKIAVLHPGVDTQTFVPRPVSDQVRDRLGWSNRRVVLTVGALQNRKGQDMMIRALPAIRARCPDVLYAVVGEGWERSRLEQLASQCGVADIVQFRGTTDDDGLVECYQQCDVFALPNRQVGWDFEGFGIALIEAQACGRPVIAGRSGGAPETVLPEESGLLVSGETPDALADATITLLDAPERRARMGEAARRWAVEQFDWSVLVPQASALFGVGVRPS